MKKILFLLFGLQALLFSNIFEWKSSSNTQTIKEPLIEISKLIEDGINRYGDKRNPIDISKVILPKIEKPSLPPEVKLPALPTPIRLTRGEFEKTVDFERRVQIASKKRETELKKLQEEYRIKVELRNKEIVRLSKEYNEKVSQRNQIIENIQLLQKRDNARLKRYYQHQKELAYMHLDEFAKKAVDKVYGKAKLSYVQYNPDAEIMYLQVTSSDGSNFKKKIEISIRPKLAKKLKEKIASITPKVMFDININNNKKLQLGINSIIIPFENTLYTAEDVTSQYVAKEMFITIKNRETNFVDSNETKLALQKNQEFQLQNPNLNDKISFGTVAYSSNGAIIGSNILLNKAKALPNIQVNPHRWLFMISVEKYAETDNVLYATRSAEALKKTMQKRLGIDDKHSFILFNAKATSGAIKDSFLSLLAKVKSNDTIYFYYSGHGVPGSNGDAYILPEDKIVDFIDKDSFFKLENIYKELADAKAKHSFVFIDACFSGKTDNKLIFKGVAPGLIRLKKTPYDKNKLTIMTAGKDSEFSNMYKKKKYRLFSYYLTKSLLSGEKSITILYKKVNLNVLEKSEEMGDRYTQTPQIYGNESVRLYE